MNDQTRDEYASGAAHYDLLLEPLLHHIRKKLTRWIKENRPGRILDIGCGTGKQLAMLPANLEAIGIDLSPAMLQQADKKKRTNCIQADAIKLPFADDSFDLAVSQFALHEKDVLTRQAELAEIRRILKPSGLLSITDFDLPYNTEPLARLFSWGISQIERRAGGEHYQNYQAWMNAGGCQALISSAGWQLRQEYGFYRGNIRLSFWQRRS